MFQHGAGWMDGMDGMDCWGGWGVEEQSAVHWGQQQGELLLVEDQKPE